MKPGFFLFVFIFLFISVAVSGQTETGEPGAIPTPDPGATVDPAATAEPGATIDPAATGVSVPVQTPVPYEKDEFPQWAMDLRRAEVIIAGSIPFTFFVSSEIFDVYRYVGMNFDTAYAPWPFKSQMSAPYTEDEKMGIILTAVGISVTFAIIDYIIVRVTREKKQKPEPKK